MRRRQTRLAMIAAMVAFCALGLSLTPQALIPRANGDRLQVIAPSLHFLSGKALEHLHDGASVPYAFQMTLTTIPRSIPLQRAFDRFIVSYDVWAERFRVVQSSGPRKAASNLTANAAEAWCLEQMGLTWAGAPMDKDLWLRLEIRAEQPLESPLSEAGLNLTTLVSIFSQKPAASTQSWAAETAPFRLSNFRP